MTTIEVHATYTIRAGDDLAARADFIIAYLKEELAALGFETIDIGVIE